jgi:hypothetical protein
MTDDGFLDGPLPTTVDSLRTLAQALTRRIQKAETERKQAWRALAAIDPKSVPARATGTGRGRWSRKDSKLGAAREMLRRQLPAIGTFTLKELAESYTAFKYSELKDATYHLVRLGEVAKLAIGRYQHVNSEGAR